MNTAILVGQPSGAPSVPDLTSAFIQSDSGGNLCGGGNWHVTPAWTVTNPDDTNYQIDIDGIAGVAGSTSGRSTVSGGWNNDTGFQGNTSNGPFTEIETAQYRIKLVRKSDSVVIEQMDTDTASMNYSLEGCA